ncbi:hypothetical protein ACEWY4_024545 [Coilia grayii]|uniref:HAT C-terminal dimerisation domain-containing protein n=1 Tax=Coilia grayii TaxID=363190 RepID=A0ABD1J0S5_9TELE
MRLEGAWTSLVNHMQHIHTHDDPHFPQCQHPVRQSRDRKKWLQPSHVYNLIALVFEEIVPNPQPYLEELQLIPIPDNLSLRFYRRTEQTEALDIVGALHFKAHLIDEFVLEQKEADTYAKIRNLQDEIDTDSNDPIAEMDDAEEGLLGTEQSKQGTQTHKTLKTTVPTCWNSVLNMIRSLVSLQKEVNEILKRIGKPLLCLMPDDIKLLGNLASFLEDFEKFTLIISEVSPNLSAIPLIRARIKKICAVAPKDPPLMKKIKERIVKNLEKQIPVRDLVRASTVFDPAVRDITMTKDEGRELLQDLHEKLNCSRFSSTVFGVEDERTATDGGSESGGPLGNGGDHQFHDDGDVGGGAKRLRLQLLAEAQENAAAHSSYCILEEEIDAFLAMRTRDQGPLDFWRTHSNTFPVLSAMARCYLCISPGSVPVECLFSSTGLILNGKRSSLAPSRCNMISFIHDNAKFL